MKIIRCTESNLQELIEVAKQSFFDAFEKSSDPSNFKEYVRKAFEPAAVLEELQNPQSIFYFLKTDNNETVGYVKLRWDRSEEFFPTEKALELQRIYLLQQHWNKGYGKILLDFSETYGRENSFEWIYLIVWHQNYGAIKFYEREGWAIFGSKNFQFGNEIHHDHALRKSLAVIS
jgi:diamine N-acetyltransferase